MVSPGRTPGDHAMAHTPKTSRSILSPSHISFFLSVVVMSRNGVKAAARYSLLRMSGLSRPTSCLKASGKRQLAWGICS